MAKILLVEDDKSLREIYGVRLLAEGYDIVSAGDGEEALAMAIKERPDLIVSDVMMPKISGFDMLDILRSTTETKAIKVIMMTALSSEEQRQRGQQLGADRYLVKSQVGIEDVVRTVHEVLEDSPVGSSSTPAAAAQPATPEAPKAEPAKESAAPANDPTPKVEPPAEPTPTTPPSTPSSAQPASSPTPPAPAASGVSTPPVLSGAVTSMPPATPASSTSSPAPTPVQSAPVSSVLPATPPTSPADDSSLPQPNEPFTMARPTGLADRVIQPLEKPAEPEQQIGDMMDKELGNIDDDADLIVPPPAPAVPPAPDATSDDHGISFEETPRPSA